MGSAFVTCFGYWLGITGLLWLAAFVCNTRVAVVQLLNLLVSYFSVFPSYTISSFITKLGLFTSTQ